MHSSAAKTNKIPSQRNPFNLLEGCVSTWRRPLTWRCVAYRPPRVSPLFYMRPARCEIKSCGNEAASDVPCFADDLWQKEILKSPHSSLPTQWASACAGWTIASLDLPQRASQLAAKWKLMQIKFSSASSVRSAHWILIICGVIKSRSFR